MTSENGKNHQGDIDDRVEELERLADILITEHNNNRPLGRIAIKRQIVGYASKVIIKDLSMMTERDRQVKLANELPLDELCRNVLYGNYVPGVDDTILIERCANE